MRLSRLYTNRDELFTAIDFLPGLNIVEAQIRLPENLDRDTHNLGKSTLGVVLDFALLARRDPENFLYSRPDLFGDLVFFLELETGPTAFLTIRRSVSDPTRIWLMRHSAGGANYAEVPEGDWSHSDLSFEKARDLVDANLDLVDIDPWRFRNVIGYFLRSQDDYQDVFKLKYSIKAIDWKPVLSQMLGLDGVRVESHFVAASEVEKLQADQDRLRREVDADNLDPKVIDGRLQLIEAEIARQQRQLNALNFDADDRRVTEDLVATLNEEVARRNNERYYLTQSRNRLQKAIADSVPAFRADQAEALFAEAGVHFPDGLKHDYEQLLAFNRSITNERRRYLRKELEETESRLAVLDADLRVLNTRRSRSLETIAQLDVFERYRSGSDDLAGLRADREQLLRRRQVLDSLRAARQATFAAEQARQKIAVAIDEDIAANRSDPESIFGRVVESFSAIVLDVLDHRAAITASLNTVGNIEFEIDVFDEYERPSNAGSGNTYRKVLCAAFDVALIRAHLGGGFPKFVYHDGLFESLDDRKKRKLIASAREYAELGIQQVITVIDSDLPNRSRTGFYSDDEVILVLHDEGAEGRLFHLPEW